LDEAALRLPERVRVLAAALDPAGARVALAGDDGVVRLWDARKGGEPLALKAGGRVEALRFSRDGARLVGLSANAVRQWDTKTGKAAGAPIAIAPWQLWSADADAARLLLGTTDGAGQLVTLADGAVRPLPLEGASAVAVSGDGARFLAARGRGATVREGADTVLSSFGFPAEDVVLAQLSPDGRRALLGGSRGLVRVVDVAAPAPALAEQKVRGRKLPDGRVELAFALDPSWRRFALTPDGTALEQRGLDGAGAQGLPAPPGLQSFRYGAGGETLLAAGRTELWVLSARAGRAIDRLALQGPVERIETSADELTLLLVGERGAALHRVWPGFERRPAADRRAALGTVVSVDGQKVTLDLGRRDGVRVGDTVLDGAGYPMRVEAVEERTCRAVRAPDAPQTARPGEGVLLTGAELQVRG
ncbi:MAG: hypothetical protein ACK4N5_18700, partial [Myxococcales bacterium]